MAMEIYRIFEFDRPISSRDLFRLMDEITAPTVSRWNLTYQRTVSHTRNDERGLYAFSKDAEGSIEQGMENGLSITVKSAYLEEMPDKLENYFACMIISEPFGWKSGCPSDEDREKLREYADSVTRALLGSNTVGIKLSPKTNEIHIPECF